MVTAGEESENSGLGLEIRGPERNRNDVSLLQKQTLLPVTLCSNKLWIFHKQSHHWGPRIKTYYSIETILLQTTIDTYQSARGIMATKDMELSKKFLR